MASAVQVAAGWPIGWMGCCPASTERDDDGPIDATGHSFGTLSGRDKKLRAPPKEEPWIWRMRDMRAFFLMLAAMIAERGQ